MRIVLRIYPVATRLLIIPMFESGCGDHDIARTDFVEGEVRVYGLGGGIVASVSDPNAQLGDRLLPFLYDACLITTHGRGMLFKGEERPEDDAGPIYLPGVARDDRLRRRAARTFTEIQL